MEPKKYLLQVILIHLVTLYEDVSGDAVLPLTLTNHQIASTLEYPGYPGDGAPSTNTTWTVTGPPGSRIQLTCSRIILLKRFGCTEGVLSVRDSRGQVYICTETESYRRETTGNWMRVQFMTGALGMGRIDCVATLVGTDEGTTTGSGDQVYDGSDSGANLTSCPCSRTNEGNKKRIVGGEETGANEFSFMAFVSYGWTKKPHHCGGSILTKRHVLTAAHCVTVMFRCRLKVIVGVHNIEEVEHNEWEQKLSVHKIYKIYKKMENDIGLLYLSEDIRFNQFVGPVCLPIQPYSFIGQEVKVLGWGRRSRYGPPSRVLRSVDLNVVPLKKCMDDHNLTFSQTVQLCTYSFGRDFGEGDSGGPVLYMDPELGRWVQVGIAQFGSVKREKSGVSTLILPFFNWIQYIIGQDSIWRTGSRSAALNQSETKGYSERLQTCEKLEQSLR